MVSRWFCIGFIGVVMAASASGGVLFFINDGPGFDAARGSTTLAGMEDWESSTLPPNMSTSFLDPLAPGVANGPFPSGTAVATGMTVQSNTLAGNPVNPSPGGNLATASFPFLGTPTDQVGPAPADVSFDLIFALPMTTAVSLTPLAIDLDASGDPGTVTIRVYDGSNNLLGTLTDVAVAGFMNPTTVIGIIATEGDVIGRINIFATSFEDRFTGADNISVFTGVVPVELQHFHVE